MKLSGPQVRILLMSFGGALVTIAAVDTITWQVVMSTLGGALTAGVAMWDRLPSDAVRISDLPKEIQDSVRPPPPLPSPPEGTSTDFGDQ
jgi:hypothetical protein